MALALSSPVWVEITDPESQNTFYANLSSGECDWSLPEGAVIQHQNPAGEWWELFDDIHNLPYYYNTKTGQTEWERPHDSNDIISLTAIQASKNITLYAFESRKSVIGQRLSLHLTSGVLSPTEISPSRQGLERLKLSAVTDEPSYDRLSDSGTGMTSPTYSPTEPFAPTPATVFSQVQDSTEAQKPENIRTTSSLSFLQKATASETHSGQLSPPTSPTTGLGIKENTGNWRMRSKSVQPTSQPSQGFSSNSFVSTFQRAASMTLHRHTSLSSQPICIPTRPRSGGPLDPALPLSTSHPPSSALKFHHAIKTNDEPLQPARKSFQIAERARKFGIGAPMANDEAARKMSPMITEQQQEALRKMSISPPPASRRFSTRSGVSPESAQTVHHSISTSPVEKPFPSGTYPTLPAALQSSISQFRIAGFAQKYFSTHKKGLFRRKVPMERMLLHQKSPLSQPLIVLNKRGVQKDALRCFKIIQKLMGERKGNGYVGPTGVELGETCVDLSIQSEEDIKLVLELIKKGLDHGELRDEIYVQLCKQLTENPSREGSIKGWHLFTILLITFSPSKNLHDYLASFLNHHATTSLHPIPLMAKHCHELLRRISKRGSRAKQLTLVEIARAQEAAFSPSVFDATLERLMGRQMAAGGEWAAWRVPRLMVFLKESVIELGGLKMEGIFRISGDLGAVAELRARIELGNYDISGITDPHVPCSLLRLWIRDLPEPVIPYDMYQQCIQGAQDKDAVTKVIASLPLWHKEMITYLISFLKTFNNPTVKEATKMSLPNLAMVFAPTLLQCSSDDAPMLMNHLQAERAFVSTLISEVELADEDLRIVGEATANTTAPSMSTPPLSPSAKSPTQATSPQASKRRLPRSELSKPNESWFLILVNAFKSNFEQTLTYRESELYAWIMQAYPYYRHDMNTMQTSVKTTLSSYECFRQNGRSTWTFIPRRALVHLESLKSEEVRRGSDHSGDEDEELDDEDDEIMDHDRVGVSAGTHYHHDSHYTPHEHHHNRFDHHQEGPSDTRIRYIDRTIDMIDADSPTLSVEEIQRFKQEHSGAQARKLKRKASGGHASRPRTRSPPAALQDECSMSMEAWCNLLVQMFEASPKQKTIREIYAWVYDNYPIYQNAPGNSWQADLTAALESNPLFKPMGRGRWQMATQPVQPPMVIVNGSAVASGSGSISNPSIKAEDDATDSPSVTEDEDWKAIGSKRLLNFSFRRYSIATDTFPKNHYKVGSTISANANLHPSAAGASNATIATASASSSSVTATTSSGMLLPLDHRPTAYTTGRRFSSYHQPTPKNSPPLSATTAGLSTVAEFSSQLSNALSEETEDEDPAKRYMAPLQSAINSAVLALQTQQEQQQAPSKSSSHPPALPHQQAAVKPIHYEYSQQHTPTTPSITVQDSSAAQVPSVQGPQTALPDGQAAQGPRPEPEIVIPNGEDLASDQMDAIQALALLCGGGV
ncbi:hypothetical protein BGX33_009014 [Mortierella sp. NVP41]|nr:hypothetical protein BGX33_009014 [Mortierella sp. NVP41]